MDFCISRPTECTSVTIHGTEFYQITIHRAQKTGSRCHESTLAPLYLMCSSVSMAKAPKKTCLRFAVSNGWKTLQRIFSAFSVRWGTSPLLGLPLPCEQALTHPTETAIRRLVYTSISGHRRETGYSAKKPQNYFILHNPLYKNKYTPFLFEAI